MTRAQREALEKQIDEKVAEIARRREEFVQQRKTQPTRRENDPARVAP